jgi:hypothetical protein
MAFVDFYNSSPINTTTIQELISACQTWTRISIFHKLFLSSKGTNKKRVPHQKIENNRIGYQIISHLNYIIERIKRILHIN